MSDQSASDPDDISFSIEALAPLAARRTVEMDGRGGRTVSWAEEGDASGGDEGERGTFHQDQLGTRLTGERILVVPDRGLGRWYGRHPLRQSAGGTGEGAGEIKFEFDEGGGA